MFCQGCKNGQQIVYHAVTLLIAKGIKEELNKMTTKLLLLCKFLKDKYSAFVSFNLQSSEHLIGTQHMLLEKLTKTSLCFQNNILSAFKHIHTDIQFRLKKFFSFYWCFENHREYNWIKRLLPIYLRGNSISSHIHSIYFGTLREAIKRILFSLLYWKHWCLKVLISVSGIRNKSSRNWKASG